MSSAPKLNYDDFCMAADKLFYEHMEMPTAAKTHDLIGHGSLATHQHYLVRWKASRKRKPVTLPEQLSLKIHEKSQSYAEEIWKTLSKSQHEIHQEIKQTAKETIEKSQAEATEAQQAKQSAEQALNMLQNQWQDLSHNHNIVTTQLNETKKQQLLAEEAQKSLEKQLNELKENTAQQLSYLKEQDEKNRVLFKEQLVSQEQKAQERYNLLKNESLHEKVALQQTIEKLCEQQKIFEDQLHQKQIEIEQGRGEVRKLESDLQESKNQQKMIKQENRELVVQIHDKDNHILQGQIDANTLQQQLQTLQLKIDILQEEKLILTQEKFQLEKEIQKKKATE